MNTQNTKETSTETGYAATVTTSPNRTDLVSFINKTEFKPISNIPNSARNISQIPRNGFPHQPMYPNGSLPATSDNLSHLLKEYGVDVKYNLIKKYNEIKLPHLDHAIENSNAVACSLIQDLAILNGYSTARLDTDLDAIGFRNAVNPVLNWIRSTPWDGSDRINLIVNTLTTKPGFQDDLKHALIYKWLLSCVAAVAKNNDFHCRGVLTLQGPQGCGKTSWIKALINDPRLQAEWIKTDHLLDPSSKDSVITALSHWIVEIGELDSTFNKDVGRLKGFITGSVDKIRPPYGRRNLEFQRRTVFAATVNDHSFLVDATGNSRWWTLPVVAINFNHKIDMQQLFAQLLSHFEAGSEWWLNQNEQVLLDDYNEQHETKNPMEERLDDLIDFSVREPSRLIALKASEILQRMGYKNPNTKQARDCGGFLRNRIGNPKKNQGFYRWSVCIKTNVVHGNHAALERVEEVLY